MAEFNLSEKNFVNRELSWLEFNHRVMMQALCAENPVMEKAKFMSIVCSNLDEFFMIRVASIRDQFLARYENPDPAGLTPKQQMAAISRRAHTLYEKLYKIYNNALLPELASVGIEILAEPQLSEEQREACNRYFERFLYPVLTPIAIDRSHPFPLIQNKSLYLAAMITGEDGKTDYATVQIPSNYKRLVEIGEGKYVLIEDIIKMNVSSLFSSDRIEACTVYRITRNGDLSFDEEGAEDLLNTIKKSLKQRKRGSVIRLEVGGGINMKLLKFLSKNFEIEKKDVYLANGPISLKFLMGEVGGMKRGEEQLRYKPFEPAIPEALRSEESIFDIIKRGEILLCHPYDSFDPVVRLLDEAAEDENVLAIKQTLYRVSDNSPIIAALMRGVDNGKQITAVVELKARFDEEHNIEYGEELKKAGANVVYGVRGLKTHSKITLIIRREGDEIKRYLHLGTGNYNDITAKLYTDYSLLICDDVLGADATAFFNSVTGFFKAPKMEKLIMAPHSMREAFCELIRRERKKAREGLPARIFAKMNSLTDEHMIKELFKAAYAGVKIRLLIRGICCLRPDSPEACGNIEVRSIVGRFLEHSRVYVFGSGADELIYLSSADWMTRNLSKRVELMFPIEGEAQREQIRRDMETYWSDNVKARVFLKNNATYKKLSGKSDMSVPETPCDVTATPAREAGDGAGVGAKVNAQERLIAVRQISAL
jgi:polyphosphate kinase